MPDNSNSYEPNPTRLSGPVELPPAVPAKPGPDPAFARSAVVSEEAAVRRTMRDYEASQPPRPQGFDPRLRPIGSLILAVGVAGLFTAGLIKFLRRH